MEKHKKQIIIMLIAILLVAIIGGVYIYNKEKTKELAQMQDYIPAEEITRRTIETYNNIIIFSK